LQLFTNVRLGYCRVTVKNTCVLAGERLYRSL
jgi:hypothetical protein